MDVRPIDANALMERLTRKKADVANQRYTEGFNDALLKFRSMLHSEPTLDCATVRHDGTTSFVTTEDIDKYNSRIILDENGKSRFCRIFYEDGETDTSKWISVEDRLPDVCFETNTYKETDDVFAIDDVGDKCVGRFAISKYDGSYTFYGYTADAEERDPLIVTHWLDCMPEPPKE